MKILYFRVDRGGRDVGGGGRYVERISQADNVGDRRVVERFDRNDRGGRLADRADIGPRGGRVDDRRDMRDVGRHEDRGLASARDDRGGRDQRFDR